MIELELQSNVVASDRHTEDSRVEADADVGAAIEQRPCHGIRTNVHLHARCKSVVAALFT